MFSWRPRLIRLASNRVSIVLLAALLGVILTFNIAKSAQDQEYRQRALTLAESIAAIPEVETLVVSGDPEHQLQVMADSIEKKTNATYVVIADIHAVRLTHPNPLLVGKKLEDAALTLRGVPNTSLNHGSLGLSARGRTPIRDAAGKVVGLVSAGYLTSSFSNQNNYLRTSFLLYGFGIIFLGFLLAEFLSRRLRNRRVENELQETRLKFQERDAMLHSIKEGVVTLDPAKRIQLINDEAKRLLGLDESVVGKSIDLVMPQGRLLDLLEGEGSQGDDELVLNESFSLRVNNRPVKVLRRDMGSVITLRDRTEHIGLLRELDSVKNLTNALRAQQHEYANRMHTLNGLLELKRFQEAQSYLGEITSLDADLAEMLSDKISNQVITALLLAKVVIARERGVALKISAQTSLDDLKLDQNALITVLGNLIDNAIEATANSESGVVTIEFTPGPGVFKTVSVRDNGPGVPEPHPEIVFEDGFSTKSTVPNAHRGLGLAIVSRLVRQAQGKISCYNEQGAVFIVEIPVQL